MKLLITAGALVLSVVFATAGFAADFKVGDLTIIDPWTRATAGNPRNGVTYLGIKGGVSDDELIKIETGVARHAQLHDSKEVNGMMSMYRIDSLGVPAGGMVMLKPGDLHIMLLGLSHALKKGESFPMTLHFAKAGKVTIEVRIMGVGASNGGMDHSKMKTSDSD